MIAFLYGLVFALTLLGVLVLALGRAERRASRPTVAELRRRHGSAFPSVGVDGEPKARRVDARPRS